MNADVPSPADQWFLDLRQRFLAVARRRVPADQVEDLVQEALVVVHEKGLSLPSTERVDGMPPVAWCFQVLRNTIGNYYQRQRTRSASSADVDPHEVDLPDAGVTALEALASHDAARRIMMALDELDGEDRSCGRYLRRLLEGDAPAALAHEERVDASVLYRRIYRCRQKLRELLARRGVMG